MEVKLSAEQEQAKREQMERGAAFEELVRTKGWQLITGYFENRVKALSNGILTADDRKLDEFEAERRELIGLRKLFSVINSDMEALKRERETARPTPNQ